MPFVWIEWNMGDIISPATKICKDYPSWIKLLNTLSISISVSFWIWVNGGVWYFQNSYISDSGGPCRGWEIALRPKDWQQVGIHSFSKSNTINVWRKCNPSTWSSNIRGMWRLTFYPRNPYEATGMVKRPWDQQVFFFQMPTPKCSFLLSKCFHYFNCPSILINPDQYYSRCRSWSLLGERVKCERQGILTRYYCISYQVSLYFPPVIIVFLSRYYCISYLLLLYFLPVIIVFLPRYYCISCLLLLYFFPSIIVFLSRYYCICAVLISWLIYFYTAVQRRVNDWQEWECLDLHCLRENCRRCKNQSKIFCPFCLYDSRYYLLQANLKRHTETHIKGIPWPCNICGKVSGSKSGLAQHKAKYHKDQEGAMVAVKVSLELLI